MKDKMIKLSPVIVFVGSLVLVWLSIANNKPGLLSVPAGAALLFSCASVILRVSTFLMITGVLPSFAMLTLPKAVGITQAIESGTNLLPEHYIILSLICFVAPYQLYNVLLAVQQLNEYKQTDS